jgi:SNF2 family DNA or RNA helicase
MGRRGLVLATLMRLKQICNHAQHGLGGGGRNIASQAVIEVSGRAAAAGKSSERGLRPTIRWNLDV